MAIVWSWAFGPETSTVLQTNAGFSFTNTAFFTPSTVTPYTYAGSPARWSMSMDSEGGHWMTLPAEAFPTQVQGAISAPFISPAGAFDATGFFFEMRAATRGTSIGVLAVSGGTALQLFVDSVFKETTANFDWNDWRYVTLKWDMSTATWSGQIFVDGVAATALQTDAAAAEATAPSVRVVGGERTTAPFTMIGQIITYDNLTDPSETPRFVTRVEGNADGTNIGTWTPSLGGTDFAELDTPISSATYTENTTPAPLDRVELLTNAGAATLASLLGTTPSAIDSVCAHSIASGQTITGRALVGDATGAVETAGPTVSIGATPSYSVAVANLRPNGAVAWSPTDQPEMSFEVVSI